MRYLCIPLILAGLSSCALLDPLLDSPVVVTVEDEETGELVEVETTVGDVIADQSGSVSSTIGSVLGGINPALGLLGGGAAAALLNGARRRRKAAVVSEEAEA
jgi:hypothetical protein